MAVQKLDLEPDTDEAWARYLDSDKVDVEGRALLTSIPAFRQIFQAGLAYGYLKAQQHIAKAVLGGRSDQ